MKSLMIIALLCLPAVGLATVPSIPRLIHDDGPELGVQPLVLEEEWRIGGEDEDVIFGRILDVARHPDGEVYVLDNQLCQVVVVSPDGEHLRNLSRQGDGPGELRQPMALVFLAEDELGIGMGFPGKMVTLRLDGTPVRTLYPIGEPAEGNVGIMMSARYVDGMLVASGGRIVFEDQGRSHTERFLAVADADLGGFERILETETPLDPTGRQFVEADRYYIDFFWALGTRGRIYAPMKRDAYEVSVFDRTGELLQVFGRNYQPRKRTQEDKEDIAPLINVGGDPDNREWKISDHDECVTRILIDPDDESIWVLTPHGANDQPDGILETWDVFDADSRFVKQVPVPLGHEMNNGVCYLVGGGRLVVVKGAGSAFTDEEDDGDTFVEPLEVICYRMK